MRTRRRAHIGCGKIAALPLCVRLRLRVSYTACGARAAYQWLAMGREGERQIDGRPGAPPWRRRLAGRGERSSPGYRRRHTRTAGTLAVRAEAHAAPASRRAWGPPLHRAPGASCDRWRGPRPARASAWDTSWRWGDPISDAGSRRPARLSFSARRPRPSGLGMKGALARRVGDCLQYRRACGNVRVWSADDTHVLTARVSRSPRFTFG